MCRNLVLLAFLVLVGTSCSENMEFDNELCRAKTITSEVSPYFNWEDTAYIALPGISGNITLPWYSGSSTQIPSFIKQDYKAADGWKLVYNFCMPTNYNHIQENKSYLIFYNIFTGRLRGFLYNNTDVTSSNVTFWKISFDNSSTLLNDLDSIIYANDQTTTCKEKLVTNLTSLPVKSLSRGWNCFDLDLATYDPNIASKSIAMDINMYDMQNTDVNLEGEVTLSSEGTIITTSTQTSSSGVGATVSQGASFLGDAAEKYLKSVGLSNIASGVNILEKSINLIGLKLSSKKTIQVPISQSDIKLSTTGNIKIKGTLSHTQATNALPISNLIVPGSIRTSSTNILPSYDEALGVFYINSTPTIYESKYGEKRFHVDSGSWQWGYTGRVYYDRYIGIDKSTVKITINPAILPYIDHYEQSVSLVALRENSEAETTKMGLTEGWVGSHITPLSYESTGCSDYISKNPNITCLCNRYIYYKPMTLTDDQLRNFDDPKFLLGGFNLGFRKSSNVLLKVTVTLYPKAPYNTAPIVLTRSVNYNVGSTPIEF